MPTRRVVVGRRADGRGTIAEDARLDEVRIEGSGAFVTVLAGADDRQPAGAAAAGIPRTVFPRREAGGCC